MGSVQRGQAPRPQNSNTRFSARNLCRCSERKGCPYRQFPQLAGNHQAHPCFDRCRLAKSLSGSLPAFFCRWGFTDLFTLRSRLVVGTDFDSYRIRRTRLQGFSRAIWRIRCWTSGGIRGRREWHFLRQKGWKPLRCQPMKVLGVTTVNALHQSNRRLSRKRVTCWLGGPSGFDPALLIERELFAQEEILGCKRAFGS
jgi:hypothetical protein